MKSVDGKAWATFELLEPLASPIAILLFQRQLGWRQRRLALALG
jgi:hypothetical protein